MSETTICISHPDSHALADCSSCARTMCQECWRRTVDDEPWCEGCVALLKVPTPAVLYVFTTVVTIGLAAIVLFKLPFERDMVLGGLAVAAVLVVVAAFRLHSRAEKLRVTHQIEPRPAVPRDTARMPPRRCSAYRGRLRRMKRALAPPVSGSLAGLLALTTLALIAGVVPTVLRLPRWIEWQLVMVGWWLVWTAAFGVLLYRGWRIAQDVPNPTEMLVAFGGGGSDSESSAPTSGEAASRSEAASPSRAHRSKTRKTGSRKSNKKPKKQDSPESDKKPKKKSAFDLADGCSGCSLDGEVVVALIALAVLLLAAFILVEVVAPLVVAAAYWFSVRALARVANDHHECKGSLVRSAGWGALWAALYTAPLAAIIWLAHVVLS